MEGNDCYKYHTLRRFLTATGGSPVRTILEIGANIGSITLELAHCFLQAQITAYELLEQYAATARERTALTGRVEVLQGAVTSLHLFADDLGQEPREASLHGYLALPESGPGYRGGSFIAPTDQAESCYRELPDPVPCWTLREAVDQACARTGAREVDFLKSDSEGSECSFLGCADQETLQRIRYLAGEYHELRRFWPVARRLMTTHRVNLIGNADLGAFFCERINERPMLLKARPLPPRVYEQLHEEPLHWHPFDERWVLSTEKRQHGLGQPQSHPQTCVVPNRQELAGGESLSIPKKPTAFIISGVPSSGNRLVVSILSRSGCTGNPSTLQPKTVDELPDCAAAPYACIVHSGLAPWIAALRARGFEEIVVIVVIREPVANVSSMIDRGHVNDFEAAWSSRSQVIADNLRTAVECRAKLEIITYEGLTEEFLQRWLPRLGLAYRAGSLALPGQLAPHEIHNQNMRHYVLPK